MITFRLSGHFLSRFFQEGMLYEPILIQRGLPADAKYAGVALAKGEPGMILVYFEASGPDRTIDGKLINVQMNNQAENEAKIELDRPPSLRPA